VKAATAGKVKAAPKKKVLADHDNNAEDDALEEDEMDDEVPAMQDEPGPSRKKKSVSDTYQKVYYPRTVLNRGPLIVLAAYSIGAHPETT
jgi:DNA topoisomerase-2